MDLPAADVAVAGLRPFSDGTTVDHQTFFRRAATTALAAALLATPALTSAPSSAAPGTVADRAGSAGRADGVPVNLTKPSISSPTGRYAIGVTLTADPGTWDEEGVELGYRWQVDGTDVATTATYVPVVADLDKQLAVVVTATLDGAAGEPASSDAVTVDKGDIRYLTLPEVSGDARPGAVLTVDPGTWDVPTATANVVWYDDSGLVVSEATTYRVRPADVGREISAWVRLEDPSYYWSLAFDAVVVQKGTLTAVTAPRVAGTPTVGRRVSVVNGTWSSADGVSLSHQWTVDGKPVRGVTGSAFTVPASAAGRSVAVVETAGGRAWTTAAQTSPAVKGRKAPSTAAARATSPARGKVTVAVTVRSSVAVTGRVTVTVGARSTVVTLRSGRATVSLTRLRQGTARVTVRYAGSTSVGADSATTSVRVR